MATFACLALGAPVTATSSAARGASGCPHASSLPNETSIARLRKATLCLLNKERAAKNRDPLSLNLHLNRMGKRHTRAMLAHDCFKHRCGNEDPLAKRLKTSGYLAGAQKWAYAEVIGYEATPAQMVNRWMHTTFDRRSIMRATFADVGLGLAVGAPVKHANDKKFVTYTAELAWRKPPA